jgi:hypothetical protein
MHGSGKGCVRKAMDWTKLGIRQQGNMTSGSTQAGNLLTGSAAYGDIPLSEGITSIS